MLNHTKAVELRKMLQELKGTVQSLEIFMNSIYWGTMKNEPDEQVSDSLEWLGKGIKELLEESHALANWFKDANKSEFPTACTASNTGNQWQAVEQELYAMSEQLELAGNEQHEKADRLYDVANQLHALNLTGETDEMTLKQKQAFFSLVEDDYIFIRAFNEMKQEYKVNTKNKKGNRNGR